ncbi:MAG: glycosyl hydrolase 115 family protein [Treponema sp.]|nr:glycosyl hydrolase 115 family protein [Treponema sp.]
MKKKSFKITYSTKVSVQDFENISVKRAVKRFYRDISMTLKESSCESNYILIKKDENLESEAWTFNAVDENTLLITAKDNLGVIYSLNFISEHFLKVLPFWFWNNQNFIKAKEYSIPFQEYKSSKKKIKYRGWFINDEVILNHWNAGHEDNTFVWEMALESLLRLGGNMVIPGTGKVSHKQRNLAGEMGLYITHHHAEPLGAEMFVDVYPGVNPSYLENASLYEKLWKKSIEEQKDYNIIWNLGFRGQGDMPFWANATDAAAYDTDEKKGKLISDIIKKQYDFVHEYIKNPVCSTNLYGEIMELYKKGFITFPSDVIVIWGDNGFGKMVSRRQGNNNPRVASLPTKKDLENDINNGIYYHVSFYDLQAASHITQLSNSPDFVFNELHNVLSSACDDFWIINCSNIKPHVYQLSLIADLWNAENPSVWANSKFLKNLTDKYLKDYYKSNSADRKEIKECIDEYFAAMVKYGKNEDDHAGEQFYNYLVRDFITFWLKNDFTAPCKFAIWATGEKKFSEQIDWFYKTLLSPFQKLSDLCDKAFLLYTKLKNKNTKTLFSESFYLQILIHKYCCEGSVLFCESWKNFETKNYKASFVFAGKARDAFKKAVDAMVKSEGRKWKGFYDDECLSDIRFTVYCLESLMRWIRLYAEGPHCYSWLREYLEPEIGKGVAQTNTILHPSDEELYQVMK